MNLINVKNMDNEYLDSVRYCFDEISKEEDLYKLISFLQQEGYDFSKYDIYYEHDHTDDLVINGCEDVSTLIKLVNKSGISNVSKINFYGNCYGTILLSDGIVNVSVSKKKHIR